jgi:hypothetical protein
VECWGAWAGWWGAGGDDDGDDEEDEGGDGVNGGKSGIGKLLGGGALLNAGPAHLLGAGDLGGEPPRSEPSGLSTSFSCGGLRCLGGDKVCGFAEWSAYPDYGGGLAKGKYELKHMNNEPEGESGAC